MKLAAYIWYSDKMYIINVPSLMLCTYGLTISEAIICAEEAIIGMIETYLEFNESVTWHNDDDTSMHIDSGLWLLVNITIPEHISARL